MAPCSCHRTSVTATDCRLPVDAVLMQDAYLTDAELLKQIAAADDEAAAYYKSRGSRGSSEPALVGDPRSLAAGRPGVGDGGAPATKRTWSDRD